MKEPLHPPRGFPNSEYKARTGRAQARMAKDGLDGVLVTSEAEIRYFTGFQTQFWQSPTRPWFLFVPASGLPIAIIPEIGAALMRASWIDDIRTWPAPVPKDDGISVLADVLKDHRRIGLPKGHETSLRMPLADYERLAEMLPHLEIVDATGLVQGLRQVKSDAEIEKITHICRIGSAVFELVPAFAEAGAPLDGIFRKFKQTALSQGADDVPYLVGSAGTGGYFDVISPPTARPLCKGDILMMDTGCVWDGYFCDFDRNWAIGSASVDAQRAYDTLWRATEAGFAAAKVGATCRDVFSAMSAVTAEMDDTGGDIGRLGHGLGMQLTEQPSLAGFEETVLQPNMVLTLEPSLSYGEGLMMVHEENIVVRDTGAELLTTRAPEDLPIL